MGYDAANKIQCNRFRDLPTEGLSPNWTICLKLTPVAGKLA